MRQYTAWVLLGAAVAGVLAVVVFVVTRSRGPEPAESPETAAARAAARAERAERAKIEVSGTEVVRRDANGQVIWRVAAEGVLEYDEQQRAVRAEDVKWVLEKSGLGDLTLTAPLMEADYDSQRLEFSRGVAIKSDKEDASFSAERIEYQFDTEKLVGEGNVKVRRGGFTGTAREMVIDSRARKVRLKGGGTFKYTGLQIPG